MKKESLTDWDRLDTMTDKDIDTSDIPSLNKDFFENATLCLPENKRPINIRIDVDVLDWFKSQGKYQTRINAVLRMYMNTHKK